MANMTDRLASAPRLCPIVANRLDMVLQFLASFRIRTFEKQQEKMKYSIKFDWREQWKDRGATSASCWRGKKCIVLKLPASYRWTKIIDFPLYKGMLNLKLSEYKRTILFSASDTQTSKKSIIPVLPITVDLVGIYDQLCLLVQVLSPWAKKDSWKLV